VRGARGVTPASWPSRKRTTGTTLRGRKVAILLAPAGTEQAEFTEPRKAVTEAGAVVDVIGVQAGPARTYNHDLEPGETFTVDKSFDQVSAGDYDALIVPGGTVGADKAAR
jgi:protease I